MKENTSRRKFIRISALASLATGFLFPGSTLANSWAAEDEQRPDNGLVFLFQGDSITDGNRGRNADPNHIMGHGYAFAVASRIGADFPGSGFTFYNRGISGNKVPDLQKRWQNDALSLKPDVLSILIGINDTAAVIDHPGEAPDVEAFEKGYRDLLQQSRIANPDILLVMGVPFVYPVGKRKDSWERWRDQTQLRAEKVRKLAAEFDAVLIDYPAVFDKAIKKAPAAYWVWDGIHPTVFAHELMAREWIRQVSTRLKFLRKYR